MQSISQILIAVDLRHGDRLADDALSPTTSAAIQEGLELAACTKASVTFCTVLEISEQAKDLIREDEKNIYFTVEDFARKALSKLVDKAQQRGISAVSVVRIGSSWEQLLKQIEEGQHDLVVVGTRRRSGFTRALFGSTAQRLLRTAPCAVWIVKPEELRDVREIAVATDLTDACQTALHSAVYVARLLKAKLYVVHALEYPFEEYLHTAGVSQPEILAHRQRLRQEAQGKIDAQLQQTDCRTLPFGVKTELLEGSPDEILLQFVHDRQVDLLILGSHGHTGISRMVLGNTAERILPNVNASVLTIRAK